MKEGNPVPRMRKDLEIIPTSYQGERALVVRDLLGLVREPIILQGDALHLLGLIDGSKTIRDLQVDFVRLKKGILIDAQLIENLVRELDSACLLQSRYYFEEKEKVIAAYARLEAREASHAGQAYPASPRDLRLYLDSVLAAAEGGDQGPLAGQILALVAPHIDLEVGKKVYAKAYRSIRGLFPRRVFLLGTGHSLEDGYFCLTEKDYLTPLGRSRTDRNAVRRLKGAGGRFVSAHDIPHRREHSLEFQLLFLHHLFGSSFSLVPILCGSFTAELERVSRPSELPDLAGFFDELRRLWEEDPRHTLVVAGIDFSHIGPKFGHRERATSLLLEAKAHDQALLRALARGDVAALWAESKKVGDRYNVCGFSTLASLLEVFPEARGRVLDYEFWREGPTQSAVSYAAVLFAAS